MRVVTVYSSRNNDDGTQSDNKMFWNAFEQENETFESQLQQIEKLHRAIYNDIIAPDAPQSHMRISDHYAYRFLDKILEDIYVRSNGCVILEMFLYAAKAVPGLLPSDSIDREPPRRDITNAYTQLLAGWMNRSIHEYSERDRRNTSDNASIKGYIHILKSWPKAGTWNEIQRLAIRVYGEMRETSEEIEEVLFGVLQQAYNYTSAFDVLLRAEAVRGHSEKRLNALLRFVCVRRNDQSGIYCTEDMLERFAAAIDSIYYDDNALYNNLRNCYQELKHTGPAVKFLNRIFQVEETDPLKDFRDRSEPEMVKYISTHFEPADFGWRRWLENLDNKQLFDAVRTCFEKTIYPSGNIQAVSYALCDFAGMRRMEQGRDYVLRLNTGGGFSMHMDRPVEKCIFLCAQLFAGVDIPVRDILAAYEAVSLDELDEIKSTVKLIIKRNENREEIRSYIQSLVERTAPGDEKASVQLLNKLDQYYHFPNDPELQKDIIPFAPVLRIIEQCCGYDPNRGDFVASCDPSITIVAMNYIRDDITYFNKGKYKCFLQAACQTAMRGRAEQMLVEYFSNDING